MAARHWLVSGVASIVAHGALFAGLGFSMAPKPVEQQPVPKSELTVTSYQVDQSEAPAQVPEGQSAREQPPEAPKMGEGTIPRSSAAQANIASTKVRPASAQGDTLNSVNAARPITAEVEPISKLSAPVAPISKNIQSAQASADNVAPSELPQAVASVAQPQSAKLGSIAVKAPISTAITTKPDSLMSAELAAEISSSVQPESSAIQSSQPASAQLNNVAVSSQAVGSAKPPQGAKIASLDTPPAAKATQASLPTFASDAVQPPSERAEPAVPKSPQTAGSELPTTSISQSDAPRPAAPQLDLPSEFATAALAWSGEDERVADPVSLAAIQAFMQPSDLNATGAESEVRDGIEAVLASVPCARLQTEFDPDTGSLLLRGHIPEDGLRGPVLDALKAQIGNSIPIQDTLLILPRPQCGALSGIAEIGLPQSTDQVTNPRVVGPQGFARNYKYSNGQRLVLELGAPDYPSVVYVDYFSADGMVLHLQPNTIVPLEAYAAKSAFTVGKERSDGPSVNLTISPPFGQEIAVAFAASTPVYDGLRPVSEPAEPYLEFLRNQIAQARARDPNFKGEWVYFFISTTPQ